MFAHKDPESGKIIYPELEMVRLAIPRRVYTSMHMQYVPEALAKIYRDRKQIKGYKIEYKAEFLRHFTARLRPVEPDGKVYYLNPASVEFAEDLPAAGRCRAAGAQMYYDCIVSLKNLYKMAEFLNFSHFRAL